MTIGMVFMVLGAGLGLGVALALRRFLPAFSKRRRAVVSSGPATRQALRQQARRQQKIEQARKARERR